MKLALVALICVGCGHPAAAPVVEAAAVATTMLGEPVALGDRMPVHARPVVGLAVDPAGEIAVSAAEALVPFERELGEATEPGIHVWQLATGRLRARLGDAEVQAMAATPDASVVAALDPAGHVVLWTIASGARRGQLDVGTGVRWIGLDAQASVLYTVERGGQVARWDIATGKRGKRVEAGMAVRAAAGSPRGVIVVGGEAGAVAVVDLAAGTPPRMLAGLGGDVAAIDVSADGTRVAAIDEGHGGVWDLATGAPQMMFLRGGQAVRLLADGRRVVVSSPTQGQQLAVIELATGRTTILDGWSGHARAIAELPGGRILAGTYDGPIRTFDLATGRDVRFARGQVAAIQMLGFTAHGAVIASAGAFTPERTLRWSALDQAPVEIATVIATALAGHVRVEFRSADPGTLSVAGAARPLRWPLEYAPTHTAMSGDERVLVATSPAETGDGEATQITAYDLAAGGPPRGWMPSPPVFVQQVGVSPDGAVVALGGDSIALYDRATGAQTHMLVAKALNVAELAFTDNGKLLIIASESDGLQIWNAVTGQLVRTLAPGERGKRQGSGDTAYCAAVSPDGTLIVSGHRHGSVKLWQLATGRLLASVDGHRGLVTRAAFSPDGRRIATGDQHGEIRVWPVVAPRPR